MRVFLLAAAILCMVCAHSAAAQESGGLLAVPDRSGSDVLNIPKESFSTGTEEAAPLPAIPGMPAEATVKPLPVKPLQQAEPDPMAETERILSELSPEMQDYILGQADQARTACLQNFMLGHFYDCECYARVHLHKIVRGGPDTNGLPEGGVITDDYKKCVSTPGVAGYVFDRCHTALVLMPLSDEVLEDICGCTARQVAADYKSEPVLDMDKIDRNFNLTLAECQRRTGYSLTEKPRPLR
jgi:hypothetical protein